MYDRGMEEGKASSDSAGSPRYGPRIQFVNLGGDRVSAAFQAARRQPNGAAKAAVLTFLIIIAIPILVLLLIAMLAATAVFTVLMMFNWIATRFRGTSDPGAGRRNVRVIRRD